MFFIMYEKSEKSHNAPFFQVSPISSQSLSSPLSSKKSNQTIVSAKKLHNPLDNEIFLIHPPNTTVCIGDNNHNKNEDFQHTVCQTVNKKNDKRSTKEKNNGQKSSLCSQLFPCCVSKQSKPAKNSSFFTRPNDNDDDCDNNDNHKDTGNKQKLITESPSTEVDYLDNSDEATLRLKDSFRTYEERQKYKSIIQDAPLYQIYTEKASISESRRDARRLLALVQPGSLDNPSNNLKFDDELFTAIDGDESDPNNPYSQKVPGSLIDSQQSSIRMKNSERRDLPFHPQNSGSSSFRSRNSDSLKTSSVKRAHSNSNASERSGKQNFISKPRRQTQEVQSFVNEVAGTGPNRVQWFEMPQVISAGLARDLPDYQKKLQEALFEVITSEASYYRTLHILIEKFYKAQCMQPDSKTSVITAIEKRHLFSNISEIFFTSETFLKNPFYHSSYLSSKFCLSQLFRFLRDMELYFIQNPLIPQLCEIIYEHTENHFENYVKYVQNQMYQLRTLTKLLSSPAFVEAVRSIQQQPSCGFLDLNSFLLLPMQRVTRLRLLLTAILHYAPKNGVTYQSGLVALASIEKLISKCDSEKARMEQKERLVEICRRLEYKYDAKSLATESRTLVKEGDLRLLTMTNVQGSGFHRRFSSIRKPKATIATLFLFSDYLLITKKRSSKRERWLDGLSCGRHGIPENLGSDICECPQVLITKSYSAIECDELELKEGDQVNVLVSLSDGWLKGALPDGRRGWFPSHICTEVKDSSMKRENMKNFMLMEEAKAAYSVRKSRETFDGFPKMKDIQNSDRDLGKIRPR
ncbi:neuronal guanine nucleotide exchange factor [Schistosoma bovis]|uniref:Neuronal guanine nucleotide exchange factor n=1 Tax=Schistosoma bovis TaxID=6184 RepID=A0A430QNS3_SCHBO|nr:neuronal guanine nucleotide exchange factor [Schistosoma bovis]